ncbi:MAG TPA: hypothetical protein VIQ31_21405 [Phormidium sp.]
MNAYTFDGHSVTCPICYRSQGINLSKLGGGLYMCPFCHERFVISQSGHYVRDPQSIPRYRTNGQMLRRQSRPLARMRRDFRIAKPISLIAIIGSAIFLGYTMTTLDEKPAEKNPIQQFMDWVTKPTD